MPLTGIDLDGDGRFESDEALSGLRSVGNPLASVTLVAGEFDDVILSSDKDGGGTESSTLDAMTPVGRVSWRELEP